VKRGVNGVGDIVVIGDVKVIIVCSITFRVLKERPSRKVALGGDGTRLCSGGNCAGAHRLVSSHPRHG
jgi:hypothetical protein